MAGGACEGREAGVGEVNTLEGKVESEVEVDAIEGALVGALAAESNPEDEEDVDILADIALIPLLRAIYPPQTLRCRSENIWVEPTVPEQKKIDLLHVPLPYIWQRRLVGKSDVPAINVR